MHRELVITAHKPADGGHGDRSRIIPAVSTRLQLERLVQLTIANCSPYAAAMPVLCSITFESITSWSYEDHLSHIGDQLHARYKMLMVQLRTY